MAYAALCVFVAAPGARAVAPPNSECVERSVLKAAKAAAETPIPDAQVKARYGKQPDDIVKKFPEIDAAIRKADPRFFPRQAFEWSPKPNKAVRLKDGRELVLMSGCRRSYHCDANGYAMVYDASQRSVAIVEQTETPNQLLVFGAPDQTLRAAAFKLAAGTLHERKGQAAATAKILSSITMLPQAPIQQRYGDPFARPEIVAAIHKVYGDSMVGVDSFCGVRFSNGHEYLLMSGTSSHAEGFIPHGVAYDPSAKMAFVLRNDDQGSSPHYFGNPDATMRTVLASVAPGCLGIRGDMGLEPEGTDTIPPTPCANAASQPSSQSSANAAPEGTPKSAAGLSIPGAPSAAECKASKKAARTLARTQLEINEQAAAEAGTGACAMREAYERLNKTVAANTVAAEKLLAAQSAWVSFLAARENERFPHSDEQGYYGSVIGMCIAGEDQTMYLSRTRELAGLHACSATSSEKSKAEAAFSALNEAAKKVVASHRNDPKFLTAFGQAQRAFGNLRQAQANFVEAASDNNSNCVTHEIERITLARIKQVSAWLTPIKEGDACMGSYDAPH